MSNQALQPGGAGAVAGQGPIAVLPVALMQALSGFGMTRPSGTTIDIAAGQCLDTTDAVVISSAGVLTADIVASGANGLDTGAAANNTWYSVWVIAKADGSVASLLSLSSTAPTMPATYIYKRRVGWTRRLTGTWAGWRQVEGVPGSRTRKYEYLEESLVGAYLQLISGAASTVAFTTQSFATIAPPTCQRVISNFTLRSDALGLRIYLRPKTGVGSTQAVPTVHQGGGVQPSAGTATVDDAQQLEVMCSTTQDIEWANNVALAGTTVTIRAVGWIDEI
jgi:hypothetical protein